MEEIKNFKPDSSSNQWHKSEQELLDDSGFQKLKRVYDYLKIHKFCHVRVIGGDYDGSIAKFTVDEGLEEEELYRQVYSRSKFFNVKYFWQGKLSWKGKRNNPKFTLMDSKCSVLLDYEGEEILRKFNLKEEGKKLLLQEVYDIDGKVLHVGGLRPVLKYALR